MTNNDESTVATEEVAPAARRRRSAPARKPEGMPDPEPRFVPEKPKRPSIEDVKGVGGMVKTSWAGIPMWQCPKCHGTTFDEPQSRVHQCKRIKYASEEGLQD